MEVSSRCIYLRLWPQSDPYVRVQINNITQGRTEVVNNSRL